MLRPFSPSSDEARGRGRGVREKIHLPPAGSFQPMTGRHRSRLLLIRIDAVQSRVPHAKDGKDAKELEDLFEPTSHPKMFIRMTSTTASGF